MECLTQYGKEIPIECVQTISIQSVCHTSALKPFLSERPGLGLEVFLAPLTGRRFQPLRLAEWAVCNCGLIYLDCRSARALRRRREGGGRPACPEVSKSVAITPGSPAASL